MKKSVCAALLVLVLALGVLPGGAWEEEAEPDQPALLAEPVSGTWEGERYWDEETNLYKESFGTWALDAAGTLTIEGSGKMIIASYNAPWYQYRDSVRRLIIGSGITGISDGLRDMFAGYKRIEAVELPDSLRFIDDRVFHNCTALTSVTLPAGLTKIGDYAFEGTCLTSLTLPVGLVEIGAGAFAKCDQLDSIAVAVGNTAFKAVDGVVFSADGKTLVLYPSGRRGAYTVPAGTEKIGDYAFSGARGLTKAVFPAGVREIGNYVFNGCDGLKEIAFPESMAGLEVIQDHAFDRCTALKELVLPEGLKTLGDNAFYDCGNLISVTFPGSLETIGERTFYLCNALAELHFSSGLKSIGNSAFSNCYALTEAVLPDGLETLEESAFSDCSRLKKAVLPGSLTRLGENAFSGCGKLTDLTLGEGISRIENQAFSGCSRIQRLMFPKSLTYIGSDVFTSAVEADIHFAGTEAEWEAVRLGYNALPEGLRVCCGSTGPVGPDLDGVRRRDSWLSYDWENESTVWKDLSLTIDNGGRAGTIAVRAALYDENGRFLGLQERTLAVEEGERTYDLGTLIFPGVERETVRESKVFLSDAAAQPLFPAQ